VNSQAIPRQRSISLICLALSCILLPAAGGCAGGDPQFIVDSSVHGEAASQDFAVAYSAQSAGGDTDVVIIDNAEKQALSGEIADAPIRHILHLRVLWKPMRDLKADHTSASNATIHWYVLGRNPGDVLEYDGTAMVVVEPDEKGALLSVRSASVHPVARRGNVRDPLGSSSLHGTIYAADNPAQLVKVLNQVREAIAIVNQGSDHLTMGSPTNSASSSAQ
jgi:hypothetical protein